MPGNPSLTPSPVIVPNLVPPAWAPGPSPTAALPLASLPPAGSLQSGTSCVISDCTVAYSGGAIGTVAVGGGTNLCRVLSSPSGWVIG
jgi:hypothetical protein